MQVSTYVFEEVAELQTQIEGLQKKLKPLLDEIKKDMIQSKETSFSAAGREFTLSTAERNVVKDKSGLLNYLIQNGLNTLIDLEPKPNVDRMKQAITTGQMDPAVFQNYVKTSAVNTFKIK